MIVKTLNPILVRNSNSFSSFDASGKPTTKAEWQSFQKWYNAKGYSPKLAVDGIAGKQTNAAWQSYGSQFVESMKALGGTLAKTFGPTASSSTLDTKKEKTGFFSKKSREERKAKRDERRANRKAKYGSRPLNPFTKGGKQFWKDKLPRLKKKANGNYEKTLPDGKTVEIPKEEVTTVPAPKNQPNAAPAFVETKDLKTPAEVVTQVVNGEVQVSKNYTEEQTEKAVDDGGAEQVYKKADVVDADSPEAKKPMSTGMKIGLALGGVAVLGLIGYLVLRKK